METKQFNSIVIECAKNLSVGNAKVISYLDKGETFFAIQCDNPLRSLAELILLITSECEQANFNINCLDWWSNTEQHLANLCENIEVKQICNRNVMYFPTIPCALLPTN